MSPCDAITDNGFELVSHMLTSYPWWLCSQVTSHCKTTHVGISQCAGKDEMRIHRCMLMRHGVNCGALMGRA